MDSYNVRVERLLAIIAIFEKMMLLVKDDVAGKQKELGDVTDRFCGRFIVDG